jgi:hypothetical protein
MATPSILKLSDGNDVLVAFQRQLAGNERLTQRLFLLLQLGDPLADVSEATGGLPVGVHRDTRNRPRHVGPRCRCSSATRSSSRRSNSARSIFDATRPNFASRSWRARFGANFRFLAVFDRFSFTAVSCECGNRP